MRFSCFAQKSPEGPEEGVEHLLWNGQSIAFTIRRGSPRRKRTLIRVTRAGKVEVILPPFLLRKEAFAAIQSRGGWIFQIVFVKYRVVHSRLRCITQMVRSIFF